MSYKEGNHEGKSAPTASISRSKGKKQLKEGTLSRGKPGFSPQDERIPGGGHQKIGKTNENDIATLPFPGRRKEKLPFGYPDLEYPT